MPLGNSGKYFANPKRMAAAGDSPDMPADPAGQQMQAQPDPNDPMIQCPSCGDTFPMSQGMQQEEQMEAQPMGDMAPDSGVA
jgi:hypothetical protein